MKGADRKTSNPTIHRLPNFTDRQIHSVDNKTDCISKEKTEQRTNEEMKFPQTDFYDVHIIVSIFVWTVVCLIVWWSTLN